MKMCSLLAVSMLVLLDPMDAKSINWAADGTRIYHPYIDEDYFDWSTIDVGNRDPVLDEDYKVFGWRALERLDNPTADQDDDQDDAGSDHTTQDVRYKVDSACHRDPVLCDAVLRFPEIGHILLRDPRMFTDFLAEIRRAVGHGAGLAAGGAVSDNRPGALLRDALLRAAQLDDADLHAALLRDPRILTRVRRVFNDRTPDNDKGSDIRQAAALLYKALLRATLLDNAGLRRALGRDPGLLTAVRRVSEQESRSCRTQEQARRQDEMPEGSIEIFEGATQYYYVAKASRQCQFYDSAGHMQYWNDSTAPPGGVRGCMPPWAPDFLF